MNTWPERQSKDRMRQIVVYFPHENKLGESPKTVEVPEKPTYVWELFEGRSDPGATPAPPIIPSHMGNAVLTDEGHDWHWTNGRLKYSGSGGQCWLLLEYR